MKWTEGVIGLLRTDTKAGLKQLFIMGSLHFMMINVALYITLKTAEFLSSYITDTLDQTTFLFQFSGFAGWLVVQTKIPEAFSITVSAVALRFVRKLILRA